MNKLPIYCLLIFLLSSLATIAQERFTGIYRETDKAMAYWNGATWNFFIEKHREFRQKGYQMIDIECKHMGKGKDLRYWGVWMKTDINSRIKSRIGWEGFQELIKEQKKQGYSLEDVEALLNKDGRRQYVGVFSKGVKQQEIIKTDDYKVLFETVKKNKAKSMYISDVDAFRAKDGSYYFLGVYTRSGKKSTELVMTEIDQWKEKRLKYRGEGLRLDDIDYFFTPRSNKRMCIAIFRGMKLNGKPPKESFWRGLTTDEFDEKRKALEQTKGLRLISLELSPKTRKEFMPTTTRTSNATANNQPKNPKMTFNVILPNCNNCTRYRLFLVNSSRTFERAVDPNTKGVACFTSIPFGDYMVYIDWKGKADSPVAPRYKEFAIKVDHDTKATYFMPLR